MGLLGEVRFVIGVKRLKASEHKRIKEERVKAGLQVNTANNRELSNFIQYLEHDYNKIREETAPRCSHPSRLANAVRW